jgi:hypothetical protein
VRIGCLHPFGCNVRPKSLAAHRRRLDQRLDSRAIT